jgi:hypothetical protein
MFRSGKPQTGAVARKRKNPTRGKTTPLRISNPRPWRRCWIRDSLLHKRERALAHTHTHTHTDTHKHTLHCRFFYKDTLPLGVVSISKWNQRDAIFIQFIENQRPLRVSNIICSSSGGVSQTAFGILRKCNTANRATANWHYTHTIYQMPFVPCLMRMTN